MEAKFYFLTIWRWSMGSMNEQWMERHNAIHNDKSSEEYLSRERFHKKTGLGNDYRFRIDYPEVLKKKFHSLFKNWNERDIFIVKESGKNFNRPQYKALKQCTFVSDLVLQVLSFVAEKEREVHLNSLP